MAKKTQAESIGQQKPFRLLRFFSIFSFIAFSVIATVLSLFFRHVAISGLLELGEAKNVTLTQTIVNSLWSDYAPFLTSLSGMSGDEIRAQPGTKRFQEAVVEQIFGLTVLKVKIYNLDGLTVFSSQESQIGADKSSNEGFLSALEGRVISDISHRDTFDAFEGEVSERDVIFSYIPIINKHDSSIEGVIEVYDDVTPLLKQIEITQRNIVFGIIAILIILYGVLLFLVRYANNLMKEQNRILQESESQFRSVFNGVNDAILVETTDGKVLDVNVRACEMFGWTYDEFLTKTLQDMVPPENQALSAEAQGEDDLTVEHFETINVRANGERFPVSVTGRIEEIGSEKRLLIVVRDITEQKKAEEELLKLSRAITQSPAAIVITDLKGTIEFVNPAFTRITGYTTEEALGQNPSILQSGEHGSEFYKVLWETISAGKTWSGEFRNKSKTGEFFWESASISPVANAEGDIKNYVAVKEDITLRKQAMADLEKAKEAAEAAAQAKTDFLANMSHEIRTPLNAIYGMTSLMQDTPLNDEQQDFIKTIRDGRDTLLSVINDILDFSKIEAGKMELEEHPFRVRGCIEDTLDLLAEKSAKKMLELAYIIEDGVPPMVIGDVTRIRQILVNLLNNALKFTDKGEVVVLLKSMLLEKNQYELQFSIRDTGIGIPKDKTGRLFQSFSQVDTSTTRKYGGTGLGLAISKELAEKMGGRMWVESEEGKGSTFHFTVIAKAEETAPLISIDQYSDFSGKRILIVDDNATNRLILIKQTESWGMKPTAVESGKEALALFEKETFDIAILDMQMPEMDGFTLSERISEMNIKNNLPMIILTSIKRDKTRATDSKIAAFLNKPIKTSNLFNVLNGIISSASAVKIKGTKKENTMDSTLAVRHPLRVLLVEDNMINQKVAAKILSRLGYQSDIASNGFEAIEALERQTYDVIFMDIQMPEMDGNEATRQIREKWGQDRQPHIIAMTAHALEGDREKYLTRGMDDYVSKPINVGALISALEKAKYID